MYQLSSSLVLELPFFEFSKLKYKFLGVWICDETLSLVFHILHHTYPVKVQLSTTTLK